MKKDIKLAGGCFFLSIDEKLIATFSRNSVYIYSLESKKLISKFKSLSNISCVAISNNLEKIAVKNTSGALAVHSLKTGEEIYQNSMYKTEGEQIYFTVDDKFVLDIDWGGRFMLFDCSNGSCHLIDNKRVMVRCDYIEIDYLNKIVYRFMRNEEGYSKGIIQAYKIDENSLSPEFVNFENVNVIENKSLIDKWNISLCKTNNYYFDGEKLIKTDKKFNIVKRFSFIREKEIENIWISENENYMFINYGRMYDVSKMKLEDKKNVPCLSVLYDLKTMEKVKDFNYPYVSGFKMFNNEQEYIISTWNGTYIGEF